MEILATKLAEIMDVTVETATKLLPLVQREYPWYKVGEILVDSLWLTLFMGISFWIVNTGIFFMKDYDNEKDKADAFGKNLKLSGYFVMMSVPLWVIGSLLQIFMSPTIMMIKEFL